MRNLSAASKDETKPGVVSGTRKAVGEAVALAFDRPATRTSDDAIHLGLCPQFETIVVRTCRSVYELIVLEGDAGDVLVRGGRKFPAFRRVRLDGSTASVGALKENTIVLCLRMRFRLGHRIVVTSPVQGLSRHTGVPDSMVDEMAPWCETAGVPSAH
jgi:hypothetical protein